jgi:hypothetical protein
MGAVVPTLEEARNYVNGELGAMSDNRIASAYEEALYWVKTGRIRLNRSVILLNILTLTETDVRRTSKSDVKPRWTTTSSGPARCR